MSARKLLLLTAVVAVLIGFIFLFERKMPSTSERERKGELHWDLPEDRIERLSLTRGAEQLEFQKTAAAPWRMVKPAPYPADAFAIDAVTAELADLKRSGGDSSEAKPADYGLEKPEAKATIVWTEPDAPEEKKTRTRRVRPRDPRHRHRGGPRRGHGQGAVRSGLDPRRRSQERRRLPEPRRLRRLPVGDLAPGDPARPQPAGSRAQGRGLVDRRAHRGPGGRRPRSSGWRDS